MMVITIDRLEGDMAVVQDARGRCFDVPATLFEEACVGMSYRITRVENPYKQQIDKLMNEVWEDESE